MRTDQPGDWSAFPLPEAHLATGMSFRDYAAVHLMAAIASNPAHYDREASVVVDDAVGLAEALAARLGR